MRSLICGSILAFSLGAQVENPTHDPPHSTDECASHLEAHPDRDAWQKPDQVIALLDIKPTDVVADLGCGSGYFTRRIAHHAATIYAVDIDEELLKLAARGSPGNVRTVLAASDDPRLPAASVDLIFICNVLHHIENRAAYYAKLIKALKSGGRIVDIDFYKKPLPVGPPPGMKLAEDEVVSEFQSVGLKRVKKFEVLPYQYFLVFERPAE